MREWRMSIMKVCLQFVLHSHSHKHFVFVVDTMSHSKRCGSFVLNLDLKLYEEAARNLRRAEELQIKAAALLRREQRERRY